MPSLTSRAFTDADADAAAALLNAADLHHGGQPSFTGGEILSLTGGWIADRERDSRLWFVDRDLVAFGLVSAPPPDGQRVDAFGGVHPQWYRQGFGRELLAWQLARAREMQAGQGPDTEWHVSVGCPASDEGAQRLFASFGMAPVRYFFQMAADPTAAGPVPVPDGITVVPYSDQYRERLYHTHIAAFSDHWGYQPRPYESWQALSVDNRQFRADVTRLAIAGDDVVSYVMAYDSVEDSMFIGQIGTSRQWRRRGVASALIAQTLQAAADAGSKRVTLGVDADSPSGAVGVYERAGFSVTQRFVDFHGSVGS
jgi:ribosomal protein S18 acetylase RimI-like enzyme